MWCKNDWNNLNFFLRLWAIESNLLIKCRFWQRLKTSKWKRQFRAICQGNWHIVHNRSVQNNGRLCILQTHFRPACSRVLQTRYGESKKARCRLGQHRNDYVQRTQYLDNKHFCSSSIFLIEILKSVFIQITDKIWQSIGLAMDLSKFISAQDRWLMNAPSNLNIFDYYV